MGSLSVTHLLLLSVILLVFFGPSRLPSLGKSVGEAIRGFKKGLNGDEIDVTDPTAAARRESLHASQAPSSAQQTERARETAAPPRDDRG